MQIVQGIVNSSIDTLCKLDKQRCVLKYVATYHTPMALENDRARRIPNITGPKFKNAHRKLFQ